jgi:hypothetical protein
VKIRALAPVILLAAFALATPLLVGPRNTDFDKAYYAAAQQVWQTGSFEYRYEGLKNLPLVAGLLSPLGAVDRDTASQIFLALEVSAYAAAFVAVLAGLARSSGERWLWLALFVSCRAWFVGVRLGQLTPVCLALLAWAFVAFARDRRRTAGALLGLAFLIKIPAGLLVLPFLIRRETATVAAAALTVAALLLVSVAWFGLPLHGQYWNAVIAQNAGTALTAYNNASLLGCVMRVVQALGPGPEGLFRWAPVAVPSVWGVAVLGASAALLGVLGVSGAAAAREGVRRAWSLEFAMALCVALAIFPVVWDHYFVFALIPLFFALRAAREGGAPAWAAFGLVFVLVNFPLRIALDTVPLDWRLLRSLVPAAPLLGVLGLLYLLLVQHREMRSRTQSALT